MIKDQDNKDLGVKQVAPKSRSYELAKAIQSKNLFGSIRKETLAIKRVLRSWKYDDVKKAELKLLNEQNQFVKIKERIVGEKKKRKPQDETSIRLKRKQKVDEDKKKQEEDKKRETEEKRTKKIQEEPKKQKPEAEPKKPIAPEAPGAKPKFKLPEIKLPEIKLPQLPQFKAPDINLRNIAGGALNQLERLSGFERIVRGDILGGGAQVLSTFGKFAKSKTLNYFDALRQAASGDIFGGAITAGTQKVFSEIAKFGINLLPKGSISPNLIAKGATGLRTAGVGILLDYIKDQTLGKFLKGQKDKRVQEAIDRIKSYPPKKRDEVIKRLQSEIQKEKSWQGGWGGTYDKVMNFLTMNEKSQSESAVEMREQVLKGLGINTPPKLADGGVVNEPTLAIIGEGGEKEYIVPESKLDKFVDSNSSNSTLKKPARIILGVVNNFISQFGKGSSDIRRMIGSDILRLERIFGRERFTLPIFTKGEGNFDDMLSGEFKKIFNGGISMSLKDAIDNLMASLDYFVASLGGEQTISQTPTGPVPQGTNADFWTLAAIASLESGTPQGQADVAQSIYNRLASGVYTGSSIKDLILASGQYQPVGESDTNLWRQIKDRDSAVAAVASHRNGGSLAGQKVDEAARNITNPQLQESARQFVGGRTDFWAESLTPPSNGLGYAVREGHRFGWFVGPGAISYGRSNPGPAPVPNFSGISTSQGAIPTPITPSSSPQRMNAPASSTGLIMPTQGTITSRIGAGRNHKGIDIAGPIGTPVVAPEDGTVELARDDGGGYGKIVVIRGSKGYHHLAHLNNFNVTVGQRVRANQQIGTMGNTGRSTGPHLHWEIRTQGYATGGVIDPLTLNPVSGGTPLQSNQQFGSTSRLSNTRATNLRNIIRQNPNVRRRLNYRASSLDNSGQQLIAIQPIIVNNTQSNNSSFSGSYTREPTPTSISGGIGSWIPANIS